MEATTSRTQVSEKDEGLYQGAAALVENTDAATKPNEGPDDQVDFFVKKDGQTYAGIHLIIDLEGASRLDDPEHIETNLIRAAEDAGATVLSSDFHIFTPNNGVSGVVILAESHISIHTWPERDFAALDVFMCGHADPMKTIERLKTAFAPTRIGLQEIKRGLQTT